MEGVVLVVAPHQDDAEIGMGGTILALRKRGIRVVILDLSDGEPTPFGSVEIRAKETKAASTILGVTERILLGLKNREIFDTALNRAQVAEVIRSIKPTIVCAPYWEDAHPDHVQASALVDGARFYAKFVKTDLKNEPWYPRKQLYFFSTHMRVKLMPSFVFDISDHLDGKMAAIRAYESQFVQHPQNAARLEVIRNEAHYWGGQIGVFAGEPFVCKEHIRVLSPDSFLDV
ncbi:MAG: bacillithiol biosynthesis deacetylase BshB1 [Pseudomonadota bacterium]|jgi:bacillithiol biosynthesis deacetylase BshB1